MITGLLVISVSVAVWSVIRNLKDAHRAEALQTLLDNEKYEHKLQIENLHKKLKEQEQLVIKAGGEAIKQRINSTAIDLAREEAVQKQRKEWPLLNGGG